MISDAKRNFQASRRVIAGEPRQKKKKNRTRNRTKTKKRNRKKKEKPKNKHIKTKMTCGNSNILAYSVAAATVVCSIIGTAAHAVAWANMWDYSGIGGAAKAFSLFAVFASFGAAVGCVLAHRQNSSARKVMLASYGLTALFSIIGWIAFLCYGFYAGSPAFIFQLITTVLAIVGFTIASKFDAVAKEEASEPKEEECPSPVESV